MIGVFDSGFGGLTILRSIRLRLPEYDYVYLGDNARTPYGSRSFEVVYEYTWQAVRYLFSQGCHLVILACNTASAKALRSIQQLRLPEVWASELYGVQPGLHRVLGVIRPTVEAIGSYTKTKHVGVLATEGTVLSESYPIEIHKLYADMSVVQQACPMWVPLIENNEFEGSGADYFVDKYLYELLDRDPEIDTILLACTHYPLLLDKIRASLSRRGVDPNKMHLLSQGSLVAESLRSYLHRHEQIEQACTSRGTVRYLTTESDTKFSKLAELFMGEPVEASHVELE